MTLSGGVKLDLDSRTTFTFNSEIPDFVVDSNDPNIVVVNVGLRGMINDLINPQSRTAKNDQNLVSNAQRSLGFAPRSKDAYWSALTRMFNAELKKGGAFAREYSVSDLQTFRNFIELSSGKTMAELEKPGFSIPAAIRALTNIPGLDTNTVLTYGSHLVLPMFRTTAFHETTHRTVISIVGSNLSDTLTSLGQNVLADPAVRDFKDRISGRPEVYYKYSDSDFLDEILAHGTELSDIDNLGVDLTSDAEIYQFAHVYGSLLKAIADGISSTDAATIARLADPRLRGLVEKIYGKTYPQLDSIGSRREHGFQDDQGRLYSTDSFPSDELEQQKLLTEAEEQHTRANAIKRIADAYQDRLRTNRVILINGQELSESDIPEFAKSQIERIANWEPENFTALQLKEAITTSAKNLVDLHVRIRTEAQQRMSQPATEIAVTENKEIHYHRPYIGKVIVNTQGPDAGKIQVFGAENLVETASLDGVEVQSVQEGLDLLSSKQLIMSDNEIMKYGQSIEWASGEIDVTEMYVPAGLADLDTKDIPTSDEGVADFLESTLPSFKYSTDVSDGFFSNISSYLDGMDPQSGKPHGKNLPVSARELS